MLPASCRCRPGLRVSPHRSPRMRRHITSRRALLGLLTLALAAAAALVWRLAGRKTPIPGASSSTATATSPAETDAITPPAVAVSHVNAVAELPRGVSLHHLRALLGQEPRHQFTSRVGDSEYLCVSYAFGEPHARLYFVFRDGNLAKITDPPPTPTRTVPYQGARLEQRLP